jgi:hypothetical protein
MDVEGRSQEWRSQEWRSPRGEKGFFPLSHSPTLPLSQVKIQNSLTVKCSIVQSHWYGLRNFNLCADAGYFNRHHSPGFCPPHLWLRQPPLADNKMQRTIVKASSINFWSWLRKNAFDFGNSINQGLNCSGRSVSEAKIKGRSVRLCGMAYSNELAFDRLPRRSLSTGVSVRT